MTSIHRHSWLRNAALAGLLLACQPATTAVLHTRPSDRKLPIARPMVWNDTSSSIPKAVDILCETTTEAMEKITRNVKTDDATFENVAIPLEAAYTYFLETKLRLTFYAYISADEELRDASSAAASKLESCEVDFNMMEDLFKLVDTVYSRTKESEPGLDEEDEKLLRVQRDKFLDNGLGLQSNTERHKFKELSGRISDLVAEFTKNYNNVVGGVWLMREEFEGLPDEFISKLDMGKEEDGKKGQLWLPFTRSESRQFKEYALNGEARMKAYVAETNKLIVNDDIFKDIMILRDERARLLGFNSHAEYALRWLMAKNSETVVAFVDDLQPRFERLAEKELKGLLEQKTAHLASRNESFDGNFYVWDWDFYNRLMMEQKYDLDQSQLSEYFELWHSMDKILEIFSGMLGLEFAKLEPTDYRKLSPDGLITWHEEVVVYGVWDTEVAGLDDDGFLGFLMLDMFPRDGKYPWMANWVLEDPYERPGGKKSRSKPTTALVCNIGPSITGKPTLMTQRDLYGAFHELGHAMNMLVGKNKYARFSPYWTETDFIEAPALMLENWMWNETVLKSVGKHYKTGEPIPDDMLQRFVPTRNLNQALNNLLDIGNVRFDMLIHNQKTHDDIVKLRDMAAPYNRLVFDSTGMKGPDVYDPEHYNNTWSHQYAGWYSYVSQYAASSHAYLWAASYSADMFYTGFHKDPGDKEAGRKFRHMILEKGASGDMSKILEEYLGRPPSNEAYMEIMGLANEDSE